MDRMKLFLCNIRSFNSKFGTFIGICSLTLGLILAFWPNLLKVESSIIDINSYDCVKNQLSDDSIKFIGPYLNNTIQDVKIFYKSIPQWLPQNEKAILIDLVNNKYNFLSINKFFLLLFIFILSAGFIYREFSGGRKYRIAHSIAYLHNSIHVIRDNWQKIFPEMDGSKYIDKDSAKEYIQKSLNEFERYFSTVTGAPCRTCIKTIVDFSSLKVETFARSSSSLCLPIANDKENDNVENNSEFYELVANKERYWHVANVDTEKNYHNSHLSINSPKKKSSQLGYSTTFTWPIRKLKQGQSGNEEELEIFGFLCVDSKVSGVFKEKYDFDSGALVADFYYFLLRAYVLISSRKLEEQNEQDRHS